MPSKFKNPENPNHILRTAKQAAEHRSAAERAEQKRKRGDKKQARFYGTNPDAPASGSATL